jgi:hypothetical protein
VSLLVTEMKKVYFTLKSHEFSISVLVEWILPFCLNIHDLQVQLSIQPNGFTKNEIGSLKKLKQLDVSANEASDLKEVRLVAF